MFCDTEFCEEVIYSFSVRGQRFGFCDTEGSASEEVLGFSVTRGSFGVLCYKVLVSVRGSFGVLCPKVGFCVIKFCDTKFQ